MVVYKVSQKDCVGDCLIMNNNNIKVLISRCKRKEKLKIGKNVIPCEELEYVWMQDELVLEPGERLIVGKDVYIEYEGNNRVYLDYERYMRLLEMAKVLKGIKVYGVHCVALEDNNLSFGNMYYLNKDAIIFSIFLQKSFLLTKEGDFEAEIKSGCIINKGECKACLPNNKVLCYGDP